MAKTDKTQLSFGPEDWSEVEACNAYSKSKTLAERKAWDIQKEQPEGDYKIEIAVINPTLIVGPNLNTANFSSGNIIHGWLTGKREVISNNTMSLVDVRDIAKMHL